jgi:hypothetical protein
VLSAGLGTSRTCTAADPRWPVVLLGVSIKPRLAASPDTGDTGETKADNLVAWFTDFVDDRYPFGV